MQLSEILKIEGILIRYIPEYSISLFNERYFKNLPNQELFYSEKHKRNMVKEIVKNSMGKSYLVTIEESQNQIVKFIKENCGIGETIEQAYNDFIKKTNKS